MQPRNPFQGQAPSNMQFPMDAYIRGVTNAANIQAEAQAKMGEAFGKGLMGLGQGIGGMMSESKAAAKAAETEKADYNAAQAMIKSPSYQKLIGLDTETSSQFSKDLSDAQAAGGYKAANKIFSQIADPLIKYAEIGRRFSQEQDLIAARTNAANIQAAVETALRLKATPSAGSGTSEQTPVKPTPEPIPTTTPAPVSQPAKKKDLLPWEKYKQKKLNVNDMGFGY